MEQNTIPRGEFTTLIPFGYTVFIQSGKINKMSTFLQHPWVTFAFKCNFARKWNCVVLRSTQAVPVTQSPNIPGEDNFVGGGRNVRSVRLEQAATKLFPKAVARVNLLQDELRGHSDSFLALL